MDYEILGRKVATYYPEVAKELSGEPALTDFDLIPEIFKNHFEAKELENLAKIAIIVKLYDPDALDGWKLLKRGILPRLALLLGVKTCTISNHVTSARGYMLVYQGFKNTVEGTANKIAAYYSKQ
tara:strand:+ start:6985 stop:7359 length:375 start_codon:yes stop_codon:yes gene_type:complete